MIFNIREILSLCLVVIVSTTSAQVDESTLMSHRTGNYRYDERSGFSNYFIKRTKRKHVEYTSDKKHKLIFKVKWVSPSEYWLVFVRSKNEDTGCLRKGDIIKAIITRSIEGSYSTKSTSTNCPGTVRVSFIRMD